jgi:uncharacterized cupin superfamily protein
MEPPFLSANSAEIPWRPSTFAKGVSVKDLGSANGQAMQLVRFEPGTRFPWHRHAGPEFVYVVEGEVIQRGIRLGPGWAGVSAEGTEEADFLSETGAVFLTVYTD